jgi:hypothetical protein
MLEGPWRPVCHLTLLLRGHLISPLGGLHTIPCSFQGPVSSLLGGHQATLTKGPLPVHHHLIVHLIFLPRAFSYTSLRYHLIFLFGAHFPPLPEKPSHLPAWRPFHTHAYGAIISPCFEAFIPSHFLLRDHLISLLGGHQASSSFRLRGHVI